MRAARLFLVPALAVLSLSAQESALNGSWRQTRTDDIAAAINTTVADMNFIKRPIARGRLTKLNPAYQKVAITISGAGVDVKLDDRAPIHMPPGGAAAPWTREDGEKFMVAAQVSGDQLIQTFKNDEGERTNVFKLSPDGKVLTLSATVKSPKLPKALTYSISFGR
ncbi:hypothetical protein GETHLI_21270 [Geothrix limicola]|uniref:Lipocalin-like domain-containing protein n=1 Tax=Geothrix limicola TaxID=2927978 RepID=A0ABQ5QHH5_9BACT|nr:hypothetical protein [Geothrix limicola]GLH73625.1 hypothetical protein GETHLI_21270 [Geothrix limicola]